MAYPWYGKRYPHQSKGLQTRNLFIYNCFQVQVQVQVQINCFHKDIQSLLHIPELNPYKKRWRFLCKDTT